MDIRLLDIKLTENIPADDRSMVDRMFMDYDPETGTKTPLPIKIHDASMASYFGDVDTEPNTIAVLKNFAGKVESKKMNSSIQGQDILVLGGQRLGKSGVGKLFVPISEINNFTDYVQIVQDALADMPE